ncbi:MAG: hypothetical protein QME50_04865 [Candidatus Bathyarchaeota archaeon]|nr:hypothetical protein [Candidatus Bathyarchaeota archaeon]
MNPKATMSSELRKLVEERVDRTLEGIEDTFRRILESQEITLTNLKKDIQSLEESFNLLSQKWNLEIYTLYS